MCAAAEHTSAPLTPGPVCPPRSQRLYCCPHTLYCHMWPKCMNVVAFYSRRSAVQALPEEGGWTRRGAARVRKPSGRVGGPLPARNWTPAPHQRARSRLLSGARTLLCPPFPKWRWCEMAVPHPPLYGRRCTFLSGLCWRTAPGTACCRVCSTRRKRPGDAGWRPICARPPSANRGTLTCSLDPGGETRGLGWTPLGLSLRAPWPGPQGSERTGSSVTHRQRSPWPSQENSPLSPRQQSDLQRERARSSDTSLGHSNRTSVCANLQLTGFYRTVDVIFGLIVDPVETGLHSQLSQEAVLLRLSVIGGYVDGPAFIVQRAGRVVPILIPGLRHSQVHPWPLVHHSDCQSVQTVLTSLRKQRDTRGKIVVALAMEISAAQIVF